MLVTELQMGGAAKMVRELSAGLRQHMTVTEAIFNDRDGIDFAGSEPPVSLGVEGGGGPIHKIINLVRRVARARALKRFHRIDVSISHLEGAHWVDVLSRGREKIVLCVHGSILHNGDIRGAAGWLRARVVLPLIYNRADRIVTVSRDLKRELVQLGVSAAKIVTISNGFDLARIRRLAIAPLTGPESRLFGDQPVVVTAGRLAEQKNHEALLRILVGLRARRPIRLLIAGDGPLRSHLLARAAGYGLRVAEPWSGTPQPENPDVAFLGVQSNPFRFIARSNVFVLSSGWEGFPLALCEAMACGTPVMSTDCHTGPREILTEKKVVAGSPLRQPEHTPSGVLMPLLHDPRTVDEAVRTWADALGKLLDDPQALAKLAEGARNRVRAFDARAIVNEWEALIAELLQLAPTTSA